MRSAAALALGVALALAGAGCAALEGARSCDPGPCLDAPDAAGPGADAGAEPRGDGGGAAIDAAVLTPPPMDSREGFADAAQCFDGLDNDDFEGVDCQNEYCRDRPVCCVGVASESCCRATLPGVALPAISACTAGPASSCAPLATSGALLFGSPLPTIGTDGSLIPNGGESSDSGLVLPGDLHPRTGIVTVRATIAAPRTCDGCIDAIGVSLAPESAIGPSVRSVVGLLVSGSRGDVSLIVGGAIAWSRDLPDDASHEYTLVVDPSGAVRLTTDAAGVGPASVEAALPDEPLRVVVHGRTTNRGSMTSMPARLLSVVATARGCDMPSALARGAPTLTAPGAPAWPADGASAPSVARPSDRGAEATRMAFAAGGSIWIAHPDGAGGFAVPGGAPALPQGPWAPGGLGDPELVPDGDRWLLLFTAVGEDGSRRIARVHGPADFGETFDPAAISDLIGLPLDDDAGRIVELDGPGAAMIDGSLWVAARAIRESGATSLVLLRPAADASGEFELDGVCGTGCGSVEEPSASPVHRAREDRDGAFDHDEVASPALVSHGGVHRLYYSGRRGTRWAIGVLVSYDMTFFREGSDGEAILAESGAGPDALGVRDPEPWIADGALTLFHTGTDGVRTRVLAASQPLSAP